MFNENRTKITEALESTRNWSLAPLAIGAAVALLLPAAASAGHGKSKFCSVTAGLQYSACEKEVGDDAFNAQAICTNVSDEDEREDCFDEARDEAREARALCREQRAARRELCEELGEDRYDPDFDPADFDADFTALTHPNPYFPLGIGHHWEYQGGDETVEVTVQAAIKSIEGVPCIVVRDRVFEDGELVEDTDDWFGQRKDGTVDYCGEISQELETFAGDAPMLPELVAIEGSFKAGRDGAKPGTLFLGTPVVGRVYRQEWSPGNAEDAARVLSTSYGFGSDPELDAFVPQALAELLCPVDDCVVTGEFSPLSPDSFEHKYYAQGIGLFLEVHPDSGEILQLVDCNFDARCAALPTP
jgi:hypothetical protein